MTNEKIRELMVEVMTNTKKGHEEAHKQIKALGYDIKLDNGCRRYIISNPDNGRRVAVYDSWNPRFETWSQKARKDIKSDRIPCENYRGRVFYTYKLNSKFDVVNFLNTDRKREAEKPSKYKTAMSQIRCASASVKNAENILNEEMRDFERMVKHHEERMLWLTKNLDREKFDSKNWKKEIMASVTK